MANSAQSKSARRAEGSGRRAAAQRRQSDPKALRHLALKLWNEGQRERALATFNAAAAASPNDAVLWSDFASVLHTMGQRDEARRAIKHALDLNSEQPNGWLFRGALEGDAGNVLAAESAYLKALRFEETQTGAAFGLGILYFQQCRFGEAVQNLQKAALHGLETAPLYVCLGRALFALGDVAGAVAAFERALSLPDADVDLAKRLAQLRLVQAAIHGDLEAGFEAYRQTLGTEAEDFAAVTKTAFHFLSGFGHHEAAIQLGRARLAVSPEDETLRYLLAALEGSPLTRAPTDYVARYFDGFADEFDEKLTGPLRYRLPEQIAALIKAQERRFAHILDLGCGTGLAGVQLKSLGERLTGIDLSPRMLNKALARGLYDRLVETDIETFLSPANAGERDSYDLVVAADVLIYFGDLAGVFADLAARMPADGLFAFSTEKGEGEDFKLLSSGRFAHSDAYIARLAERHFELLERRPTVPRLEAYKPVAGELFLLRRRQDN